MATSPWQFLFPQPGERDLHAKTVPKKPTPPRIGQEIEPAVHLDPAHPLVHHCIKMRTTVDLPEEVHAAALTVARQEGISLGAALARAWRQAARPARKAKVRNGVLVLEGGDAITPESVRDALAED